MEEYFKKDIARIINKPIRTITQWTDSDLIIPEIKASRGKGKARIYSKRNVIEFAMLSLMSGDMKIPQSKIKYILDHLNGNIQNDIYDSDWSPYKMKDFYDDDKWGDLKEICYISETYYNFTKKAFKESEGYFKVVYSSRSAEDDQYDVSESDSFAFKHDIRFNLLYDRDPDYPVDNATISMNALWLGTIKNIAIERFSF